MQAPNLAPINTCGRQHDPICTTNSNGFDPPQPDVGKKQVVIDYSAGPDSISKVMRKRTLSMMELLGVDAGREDARPSDFPKFSTAKKGFSIEKHSCKPISAMKPDSNCESKQREVSKSAKKSQCAMQQEDDAQTDQQLPMQPSDHRCRRVAPRQDCKPNPKPKPCLFPQLSLALFPMPMDDAQKCKQPKSAKRAEFRRNASSSFPQFDDGKGKKKLRVSFANGADEDITTMYTRCDPKWQDRLANDAEIEVQKAAVKENKSRDQGRPDVREMQHRYTGSLGAKTERQSRTTQPDCAQQLVKDQKMQQEQPGVKGRQEAKRSITQIRLNELQKCLSLYDTDHMQKKNSRADPSETSPQNEQHKEMESRSYRTQKKYLGACWDMYQQETSADSKESEQMEQQCTESSQDDQKPLTESDAEQQHQSGSQIYSGLNHVEFETNKDDVDQNDEEAEQPKKKDKIEGQENYQQRRSSSHVLAELEISRMEQINAQKERQQGSMVTQKRESEDYSLQLGVREASKAGTQFYEIQHIKKNNRNAEKPRSQARGHSCQEDQQQARRLNSQKQTQACTNKQPIQRQSRAEKPPCAGFHPIGVGADRPQRSESDPCMHRDRRMSPSGQQPEPGDVTGQMTWNLEERKDVPQAQAAGCSQKTERKRPKESPDISDACQEALRQDTERRRKRERIEKAREVALQEALKPTKRNVVRQVPAQYCKAIQPALTCPEVKCHCSLHSEQTCEGPARKRTVAKPEAGSFDCKNRTVETMPDRIRQGSACSKDLGNVEWVREGHLLVKLTNGKPSGSKVVSKGGKSDDIYSSGDQPVSDSGDATPQQKTIEEETMEDSSMAAALSQPNPNDLLWSGGEGENTMETTDDDPITGSKKCCC